MIKLVKKLSIFLLTIMAFFTICWIVIFKLIPPQFDSLYQHEIINKYNLLVNEKNKKIIYVSGSSGAFCVDAKSITNSLNVSFINLGAHAGLGISFINELSKVNINEGDLVILAHEYGAYRDSYASSGDITLISTAMNDDFEFYNYLNSNEKTRFFRFLPSYALKKLDYFFGLLPKPNGVYSTNSFDEYGSMIYNIELPEYANTVNDPLNRNKVILSKNDINLDTIMQLKKYKEYVESKGAKLVIAYPYVYKNIVYNFEELKEYFSIIKKELDIEELFSLEEVQKEREVFYDTAYHCNSDGQDEYTNFLTEKLNKYLEKERKNASINNR